MTAVPAITAAARILADAAAGVDSLGGVINGLQTFLPLLRKHGDGGHIVNMGSIAGRQAYENAAVYVTSKYAVRGFTYALREDLLGRPIHVTTVDPGLVESNFSRVRFRGDEEKAGAVYANVEAVRPEDVADCVAWIVSDGAGFLTGQTIVLDGGLTILSPLARFQEKA